MVEFHPADWPEKYFSGQSAREVQVGDSVAFFHEVEILTNLYYSNTFLQKNAVQIMTFSSFYEHSTPLFRLLAIMKLSDLATFHIALFMYKFHTDKLLLSYLIASLIQYLISIHN